MTDNPEPHEEEVSPRIKAAVIGLTVLTCIAGIIFFILFFKKVYSSFGGPAWGKQLLTVAEKLETDGLPLQAIETYERFLDQGKPNLKTRALVSTKLARLYRSQGDCSRAISWLYQAEAADPEKYSQDDSARDLIDDCKKKLKKNK